jgi:ribonuclease HI
VAWTRLRYRGNKVYVETDAAGAPVLDGRGLARVRYKEDDPREYTVKPSELSPVDGPAHEAPAAAERRPAAPKAAPADGEEEFVAGDDVPALAGLAIHAYTDGASSGNPGPSGIGVVLVFREHRREVSRYLGETTNNVAELTAILEALRLVKRRDLPVRVHADSSYAIGVLDGSMRAKANGELVEEIRREMRGFPDLALVKVEGHAGVELNERADALAREAIRKHRPRD